MFNISKESSLPLHIQLLDDLRHNILTGRFDAHQRLPGELELVEELAISRATIQRAWQSALEEGLIYKVPGKGTYVAPVGNLRSPSEPASSFVLQGTIGFLIPEFRSTFAMQLLSGAERILKAHGCTLMLAHTNRDIDEENRLIYEMVEAGVRGVLVTPTKGAVEGRVLASSDYRIPTVQLDRPLPRLPLPCVSSNNYGGEAEAIRHLIELGHRRILFFARPHLDLWSVAERYRAYQDTMREAGLEPLPPLLIGDKSELSSYEAYIQNDQTEIASLIDLLQSVNRPTAIAAVNDWMALKALRAIKQVGLRVPEDISLIGFDDLDISEHVEPALTTISQNGALIGAEAAKRLITLIEGEPSAQILTLIPTRFIQRASTAKLLE